MYISIWLCEPGSFRLQGIVINDILKKQHALASFISEIVKFQGSRFSSKSAIISPPMGDAGRTWTPRFEGCKAAVDRIATGSSDSGLPDLLYQ